MGKFKDLTGQRFGKLVVVKRANNINGKVAWLCQCDCGQRKVVTANNLRAGYTKSCGCASIVFGRTPANATDLTGMRFGRLTVLGQSGRINQRITWLCKCDCGNTVSIMTSHLTTGRNRSCGCLQSESRRIRATKHDGRNKDTRLYNVWKTIRQRCNNPNNTSYPNYGGRGIRICDEWSDFAVFREWALANGYDADAPRGKCTIDRIDNDGNYEPSNCRWVDAATQSRNRRPSTCWRKPVRRSTASHGEEEAEIKAEDIEMDT